MDALCFFDRINGDDIGVVEGGYLVVSKNTNELKTRVSRGVSDRRVYALFAKGSKNPRS